jgi:hypothetical protein
MSQRVFCYSVDGFQNAVGKLQPQTVTMLLVPFSRSLHVGLGRSG